MAAEIKKEIQLEIAHVLFIDIVGYSQLSINQQRGAIEELNEIVRGSPQFQNAEAAAQLIKIPTGDGMALVFYRNPEQPVECALEISRALKAHPKMHLRMGAHSGPVSGVIDVNGHANLAGAGLNIAQRVMDCGDAGHILVSKHVADDLGEYEHWRSLLHDLGECEVKHGMRISIVNVYADEVGNAQLPKKFQALKKRTRQVRWAGAVAALLVVAAVAAGIGIFSHDRARSTSTSAEKSIAVLPFENLSRDPDNAYFAEGIQDEILTRLSKIADLKVISRTSTQHYKSAPENLSEVGKQLHVAHIVEGSVQKSGDAVRVNVQLIKAADDSHLWAETFDRKLIDIFSVESEVAKAIADQLRAKLSGPEAQVIAAKPTENPEAYDVYLRGLAYSLKPNLTQSNLAGAQQHLREAVRLDPKFGLAWALLARMDALAHSTFHLPTCEESLQAADTSSILQPRLGEALMAKGYYYYGCLRDYESAKAYYQRAREVLPNSSQIPQALAFVLRRAGDLNASLEHFKQSENLDPRNTSLLTQYALTYVVVRRFDEAIQKLDQILTIVPGDPDTLAVKACVLISQGNVDAASAAVGPLQPSSDQFLPLEVQAYVAILARQTGPIVSRLAEALAHSNPARRQENAELRFWFGWAQSVAGDAVAAKTIWQQTRAELEDLLKQQPENVTVIADLALTCIGLEDTAAAEGLADRASALDFVRRDALLSPFFEEMRARALARAGDAERAIPLLAQLLSTPYGGVSYWDWRLTPALLRLDPMFDPLRNDPRFQKLVAAPPPK
jgi:TolB-like protein/Tfp pilus assembly protein PilF